MHITRMRVASVSRKANWLEKRKALCQRSLSYPTFYLIHIKFWSHLHRRAEGRVRKTESTVRAFSPRQPSPPAPLGTGFRHTYILSGTFGHLPVSSRPKAERVKRERLGSVFLSYA